MTLIQKELIQGHNNPLFEHDSFESARRPIQSIRFPFVFSSVPSHVIFDHAQAVRVSVFCHKIESFLILFVDSKSYMILKSNDWFKSYSGVNVKKCVFTYLIFFMSYYSHLKKSEQSNQSMAKRFFREKL